MANFWGQVWLYFIHRTTLLIIYINVFVAGWLQSLLAISCCVGFDMFHISSCSVTKKINFLLVTVW